MKTLLLLLTITALSCTVAQSYGQGALEPPEMPAPAMKTLDQVEARIIVNETNTPGDATNSFIISAPGSYYLTGNITGEEDKHGISIQADDVSLDLNGFALAAGTSNSERGVDTPSPVTNLSVFNGSVRGWGDAGVEASKAVARLEKLLLANNGVGLFAGNGSMVKDCVASNNSQGFFAADRTQFNNCIATLNAVGFFGTNYVTLVDCTASRNQQDGIMVGGSCIIMRCSVTRNDGDGIVSEEGSNVSDCTVSVNSQNGITVGRASTVRNCIAQANGNNGILTAEDRCQIVGNTCDENYQGIGGGGRGRIDGNNCTGNSIGYITAGFLIRNTARANGIDYYFGSNVVDMSAGGSIPAGTSPWVNFIY